jgi:hypothetical protein
MNRGSRHYYLQIIPPILSKISLPDCHTRRFLAGIHLRLSQAFKILDSRLRGNDGVGYGFRICLAPLGFWLEENCKGE